MLRITACVCSLIILGGAEIDILPPDSGAHLAMLQHTASLSMKSESDEVLKENSLGAGCRGGVDCNMTSMHSRGDAGLHEIVAQVLSETQGEDAALDDAERGSDCDQYVQTDAGKCDCPAHSHTIQNSAECQKATACYGFTKFLPSSRSSTAPAGCFSQLGKGKFKQRGAMIFCGLAVRVYCKAEPTAAPTGGHTTAPTHSPTKATAAPTKSPTKKPTAAATVSPTEGPTAKPTVPPTKAPTALPTASPTEAPTAMPTMPPTEDPTAMPTVAPTVAPTTLPPTETPTAMPTLSPTMAPTALSPTDAPTAMPTLLPTMAPTTPAPTESPTAVPSVPPTMAPTTLSPTVAPTTVPSSSPTDAPTTLSPTEAPTAIPTLSPTEAPTPLLTQAPTEAPTSTIAVQSTGLPLPGQAPAADEPETHVPPPQHPPLSVRAHLSDQLVSAAPLDFCNANLAHNNLGGAGPDGGDQSMIFAGVTVDNAVSLIVTNVSAYTPWNVAINGPHGILNCLGGVSLKCGEQVTLRFSFVDKVTLQPTMMERFNFTVLDIDAGIAGRCRESVEVSGYSGYTLSPDSTVVEEYDMGTIRFKASVEGTGDDDPTDLAGLTIQHKARGVNFLFMDVQTFTLTFFTNTDQNGSKDPRVVGHAGRKLLWTSGTSMV